MRARRETAHSSDEVLLAYLDGELGNRRERLAGRHLKACWACRARLAELEAQQEALAKAQAASGFPGKVRVQAALERFLEWERQYETERQAARVHPGFRRTALRAAAALLVVASGLAYWVAARRTGGQAEVLLSQFEKAGRASAASLAVAHQVFRVEIVQTRPRVLERRSRIEVWSDGSTGRLSFHWNDQEGRLKQAVWRREAGRGDLHRPGPAAAVVAREARTGQPISLGDLSRYGLDPERIEDGFLAWLESRQWLPAGATADLAVFRSRGGVVLTAERAASRDGRSVVRFHARKKAAGVDVALTVEVDAATFAVRLQRVRYETAERALELRLITERAELVPVAYVRREVFEPPAVAPPRPRRPLPQRPVVALESRPADLADPAGLDAAEVEALWLLHRMGACMGEVTMVAPEPPAALRIQALVRTEERKNAMVVALAGLNGRVRVLLDVQTAAVPPASAGPQRTLRRTAAWLQNALADHLARQDGARDRKLVERRAREIAEAGQRASGAVFVEGWALVRLAERFDPGRIAKLPPRSRQMLEEMVREHGAALRGRLEETRRALAPLLAAGGETAALSPPEGQPPESWTASTFALFEAVARLDDLVQDASSDAPAGPADVPVFARLAPLIDLANAGLTRFEVAVAQQFTAGQDRLSGSTKPR